MKRILILIIALLSNACFAQDGVAPGAALVLGPETGINGRFYYFPNENICFGPEVNIFPDSDGSLSDDLEISLNGHYIFELREGAGFYPLAGLNWKRHKEEFKFRGNIGAGLHFVFNRLVPYSEYIYSLGFENEGVFLIGTFYTFGLKRNEARE